MKSLVVSRQRDRLLVRLQNHENGALKRLAHAVTVKDRRADAATYSRMHNRHNKSLAN